MTVGLAMIVRDEAETIHASLMRALMVVHHVTLVDTGSTDGTLDVADESLKGLGVPYAFFRAEWNGFGPARTEALVRARDAQTDYTLMLDADHVLHVEGEQPDLTADVYNIRIRGPLEWRLPLLTRTEHPFEYRGVAHSYLASDVPHSSLNLDWLSIDGGPGASPEKLAGDLALLTRAFADDPTDARTVFYLAQTYRDLDRPAEAIQFYRLRSEMRGWDEERYCARVELGRLLCQHVSFSDGADVLLDAWRSRKHRVEALRALANAANAVADKYPIPDDVLFVRPGDYRQEAS